MAEVGVRFGKGLQLTNIVKDIAHDLQKGRCYVPAPMLAEAGLTARTCWTSGTVHAFRPVLSKLVRMAVEHLDQGWLYTMAIPRYETRSAVVLHVADSFRRRIPQAGLCIRPIS